MFLQKLSEYHNVHAILKDLAVDSQITHFYFKNYF